MRKTLIVITIMLLITALSACSSIAKDTTTSETAYNEDFRLTITVDKSVYKTDEPIDCYATIEYKGKEPFTVYHADPLMVFSIEGRNYFHGDYARNDVLERTTFESEDESLPDERRIEFQKSGGWSADDPDADFYEAFYKDKELRLPAGEYALSAQIEYSTDENDVVGSMHMLSATVTVRVR